MDQDFQEVLGRGKRPKNVELMNALIQAEGEDKDQPSRRPRCPCRPCRVPRKKTIPSVDNDNYFSCLPVEEASDVDDADFTQGSESSSSTSDSDNNIQDHEISNAELAMILPMKTVPPCGGNTDHDARHLRKKTSSKSKRKTTIRNSSAANRPQLSKRARVVFNSPNASYVVLPSHPFHFINLYLQGRELDYRKVIHGFVAKTRDLRHYELTPEDWSAIQLVSHWLKARSYMSLSVKSTWESSITKHSRIIRSV
ncbi:hypothetical protein DFJ58DRAFT_730327 [Suillus subalutaceus]|uniref:uncharacterized protein n=1 Tax=Suillus subalutaceus TaxID=48586 RepID=UPI001B85F934|nr:uncharacterized protein DFJ58DRAFT_730327 [Suillus subalutaceus]KAG1847000.1 hypothetical protein DFJ58DRAFT_730327 [Suillus subalutaceus]